jgi:glycosyltransferase involved in cell wall biosynthesis
MRFPRWRKPCDGRRVLIIVQNLPVPFDRRVWLEATTLAASGYAVSAICPKGKGFTQAVEAREGVEIYRYRLPFEARGELQFVGEFLWCFLMTAWLSVRVALFGRGFDVVQACNPPDTYWVLGWCWKLFGKRFLFDHHDLSPEMYGVKFGKEDGLLYRALLFLERMTFHTADAVLCTNETFKRIATTRGHRTPEDVFVIRSGPDSNRFVRMPRDPALKRGKRFLLIYLGEMCQQDGVEHLVRAAAMLIGQWGRRDFHLTLIGDGPHAPIVEELARRMLPRDCFSFAGPISDDLALCRYLSSADLAVIPDPPSPYSDTCTMNKVMEYMFFGLPMVGYRLHENMVSAGSAAVYAEQPNEEALARTIHELLEDPERRQRMGEAGMRRIREAFSWNHSIPNLLAAYNRLFAGAPQASRIAVSALGDVRTGKDRSGAPIP